MERTRHLGRTDLRVTRIGLGLAALGRPGYMTLGRRLDLPSDRSVEAMQARSMEVLDAAYDAGIRVFDAARSYGKAEAFLSAWLDRRRLEPGDVVVSSKWGYRYTGDWQVDAETHEVKEHSLQRLLQQWELSRQLLWSHLDVYQIHSATLDSGVLDDREVLGALARLRATYGVRIGLTLSGPNQALTLDRAVTVRVDGQPLFDTVQATWNALEPSVGAALFEAREAGLGVIIKESLANGRLTPAGRSAVPEATREALDAASERHGTTWDVWSVAAALRQPWADVVLSGAVTVDQLKRNLRALELQWTSEDDATVARIAEHPSDYWSYRKSLPWQ